MYQVIEFYENIPNNERNAFMRGHFFWTYFPYVFTAPRVKRFWDNRPTEILDINTFNPFTEEPRDGNNSEEGTFEAVTKYKKRPVIILSSVGQSYDPRGLRGGEYFLVAPLRSLRILETDEYKRKPEFVWNVILYKYNSLFYLPNSKKSQIRESVILFERITTLHKSWLTPSGFQRLSSDAQSCLDIWLRYYIFGSIPSSFNKNLEAYRNLMGEDPDIKKAITGTAKYLKPPRK